MEHLREFEEEVEIVEEESPQVHRGVVSDPSPQTRDVSTPGGGKVRQTWGAISASLGSMKPLLAKLDKLLLDPPEGCTSKKVKDGMHLLKKDVKEISSCLDKLSELEDPPPTTKCWMNEARDLSYKMEDYIDSLLFVQPTDPSVVADDIKTTKSPCKWYSHVKTPKEHKQIAATVSEFRKYAQKAIQRRKVYVLSDSKIESTLSHRVVSVSHVLPMPYEETAVVVIDGRMNEFINSLANDGDKQLKVVSVLGSACLGKTTLARVLFDRIGLQFDCRAFIRVSKKPDMNRIFRGMLSQLQQQDPPQYLSEVDLIDKIKKHILDKRYLIIVDDVWAASVWDIINHALPKGSHGSRIITTTQIGDVALTCCRYQSERIFKMKPLDYHHSRKLFFNRLFGSESDCPDELKEVSNKIVEICDGLPLATISMASLLASQPVMSVDLLTYIHKSLSSCFSENPASERTRQALNLSFNNLPHYLKTCLMYLIMYPEGYTFFKDNLVKQLVAEGFIDTTKGQDVEKVAESHLHQLIGRRFIQPIRVNFNNEVLSCSVHDAVHDLIAHKSAEENFIVAIDYNCRKNVALYHKARRLSLLFEDARYAKTPSNIIKSQVRSLTFFGFLESMPSTTEFKLIRVLNLQLCGYGGSKGLGGENNPVDLGMISELSRLRYLKIASHLCIKLPDYMGGLHCLETLDIMDAVVLKFGISVCLPYLLHLYLSLRDERNVQNWIDEMPDLDKLKHLQDLRLTFSFASLSQKESMLILRDFISGHDNLKTIVVACDSSDKATNGALDVTISWDDMAPPPLLQRFEFSPHRGCIFSRIPPWVEKHNHLSILKIAVKELKMICVGILRGLPSLTALSLYVWRETSERINFDKAGFSVLKHFRLRFTTGIAWIKFEEDAMPNLWKLKLGFGAISQIDQYEHGIISIDHMPGLREISVKFGGVAVFPEYYLVKNHHSNPIINKQSVFYSSCGDESTNQKQQTYEILEEERDEIVEEEKDEDDKELKSPADQSISRSFESSSRPHVSDEEVTWTLSGILDLLKDRDIKAQLRHELNQEIFPLEVTLMRVSLVLAPMADGAASQASIKKEQLIKHVKHVNDLGTLLANQLDKVKYQCIKEQVKKKNLKNAGTFSKMKYIPQGGRSKQKINVYDIALIKATVEELEEICNFVHDVCVTEKLGQIVEATKIMDINTRETAVYNTETKVFPREEENDIRRLITASASLHQGLLVLPIVGDGGVGKTTLARQVYNDQRVKDCFSRMIWIYVSANFDEVKITQGILQQIPGCEYKNIRNLTVLQGSIKKYLTGKFLIVLDDMWEERKGRWDKFLAPFRCTKEEGVILVTTRKLSVANVSSRSNAHINLDGMKEDMFWSFFKTCIFGDENYRGNRKLLIIGKEIATKLKGNPLGAKSVGALLGTNCNEHVWRNILDRDEWKITHETGNIMPALRLSYNHLSYHLQQLFSYCALFPKGYKFDKEQLIRMWIALGFIRNEWLRLEDVGSHSFDELVVRSFFQKEEQYFILHDLMRDLAQEVSVFKCLTIDDPDPQEASQYVHRSNRHVGIWTEMVYNEGSMERSETFQLKLDNIQDGDILRSLESFMLVGAYDENFSAKFLKTLQKLQYVRLLRLSMHFNVDALLSSIVKFIHLRYLELRYTSDERRPLPEAICKLYHLMVLDIMHWSGLDDLPKAMSNLVCLRYLLVPGSGSLHSKISRVGQLKFLQELNEFRVREENGFEISQLGSLNEIRGSLSILDLENVTTKQKASEARIKDKRHLRTLSLSWGSAGGNADVQKEVIEGLKPHDRLAHLHIINYAGATPSWIAVRGLESLHLQDCTAIDVLPPFEEMECLKKLSLIGMSSLRDVDIDFSSGSDTDSQSCEDDELELSEVEIASCSALTSIRLRFSKILTVFNVKDCVALSSIEGLPSSDQRGHYVIQGCPQLPVDIDFFSKKRLKTRPLHPSTQPLRK